MFSEHLHLPALGQNHIIQSQFYNTRLILKCAEFIDIEFSEY